MISVCMATYNGEQYLKRQLDTILDQLDPSDELIISDDQSTDGTVQLIQSYQDPRIKLLEHESFNSPVFNMEYALKQANGDTIFLADQDDVWLPGKVSRMVQLLEHYDLAISNAYIVDENEKVIHDSYFQWKKSSPGFWKNLRKNAFLGCAMAFNRKVLKAALPFPENLIMHDVWIGLLAERLGKVKFDEEKLMLYRRHALNFTAAAHKDDQHLSDFSLSFKVRYRSVLLDQVMRRVWSVRFLHNRHN